MGNIDHAYHPAWRTVILPYLEDQKLIDQLYCSSKVLQGTILTVTEEMLCWCRPMDSVIKNKGIYPSYISSMSKLRSVKVKLEPRLEHTWKTYVDTQCDVDQLCSNELPVTLEYFENELKVLDWQGLVTPRQRLTKLVNCLDRFPNIAIGVQLKSYMVSQSYIIESNAAATPSTALRPRTIDQHPEWLRYQYITKINLEELRYILAMLIKHGDPKLTANFAAGVNALDLGSTSAITEAVEFTQLAAASDPYVALYDLLPNLTEIVGNAAQLPNGLTRFIAHNFYTPDLSVLPPLPSTLTTLSTPSSMINSSVPWILPSTLTALRIGATSGSSPLSTTQFTAVIKALPAHLRALTMIDIYSPSEVLMYWNIENILALPRALEELETIPYLWSVPGDPLATQRLDALPPKLTNMWITYDNSTDLNELLHLPSTLTYIGVVVSRRTADLVSEIISHFVQLSKLRLLVDLADPFTFPHISLPPTLSEFTMLVTNAMALSWTVPLIELDWPEKMHSINIQVDIDEEVNVENYPDVNISSWYLPKQLSRLMLEHVTIEVLPNVWPEGLSSFVCSTMKTNPDGDIVDKVWPDLSSKIYYFPNSTICYSAVEDTSGADRYKTTILKHDKATGRPYLHSIE